MKASFWHRKWEINEIGFHETQPHPLLIKYLPNLQLNTEARVFVPLCGKSLDMIWIASQGYNVVGVELSPIAAEQFFSENNLTPKITQETKFSIYQTERITIFVGDVFELSETQLGSIDAIYDRAALVALPLDLRKQYAEHLIRISNQAKLLLISFNYDQRALAGPPFSISEDELKKHYSETYQLHLLESAPLKGGLKRKCEALEQAWQLTKLA